jgi:hypothetical protein
VVLVTGLIRWHGDKPGYDHEAHAAQLGVQLRAVIQDFQTTKAEHERWKERLTARLHEEADNRDYCSEFDDVMEELGLPRRRRPIEVTVTVTVELSVTRDARDDDEAVADVLDGLGLREGRQYRLDGHGVTVTDVEAEVQ